MLHTNLGFTHSLDGKTKPREVKVFSPSHRVCVCLHVHACVCLKRSILFQEGTVSVISKDTHSFE